MTEKTVRHTASLLGIAILVAIVTHWNSMASILPGLIYLMAANLMCIASIFAALNTQCVGYVRPTSLTGSTLRRLEPHATNPDDL
jgi:hypothetical protein